MKGHKLFTNKSHSEKITSEALLSAWSLFITSGRISRVFRIEIPDLSEVDVRNEEKVQLVSYRNNK